MVFRDQLDLVIFPEQQLVIEVTPEASSPATTRDHLLVDQVLPRILSHEGRLVLHAGAVDRNGRSLIFVGESGYGKSSLVASFDQAGLRLIGDDALVISLEAGRCCAAAVYPSLRLFSDSIDAVLPAGSGARPVSHYTSKLRVDLSQERSSEPDQPLPIEAIFILGGPGKGDKIKVRPMTVAETCISLIRNSFALDPTDTEIARKRLGEASAMANQVPAYEISYPHDYTRLAEVRQAIIACLDEGTRQLSAY